MRVGDLLAERKQVYEDSKRAGDVTKINHIKQTIVAKVTAVEEDVERSNGGRGRTIKVIFDTAIFELSLIVNNRKLFSTYSHNLDHIISTFMVPTKQGTKSPPLFQHESFNIFLPSEWKAIKNPEPGIEIGFTDGKIPVAKWYLHYEIMPKYAGEPPSDAATLRAMANQFDNLVRQQFPSAKKLSPRTRKLPGKKLVHLLYELKENNISVMREYVYLFACRTAYVIQATVPKARKTEVTPAMEMLFRTFKPRAGAEPIPRTADQALKILKNDLPELAASMPVGWRPTIREVKFLTDIPKKGDVSLLILASWPRRELKKEFLSTKEVFSSLRSDKVDSTRITQANVDLVQYVGQLLGLTSGEVYDLKPAVTYLTVSMQDSTYEKVGMVRIKTKDLLRIISGDVQPMEAASLYEFK